jgi:DNA-binding winged helix-turn-helix (wHTH) protein
MSNRTSQLYDFGPYRLDPARRVFTREGQVIPLAPKTFELLRLLVEGASRAFSKQELMAALWPDTFVEEANLSFQISMLRKGARRWRRAVD